MTRNSLLRRLFLLLLLGWRMIVFAQSGSMAVLPGPLVKTFDSLKRVDNLEEWLITAGQYVQELPIERLPLLKTVLEKAWRTCKNDEERMVYFSLLNFDGYYQLYTGRILASIDAYEKAYQFYSRKPFAGAELVEYCLKPLGNNYTRLGDYDRAFYIQEKSLAMALAEKDSMQAAAICNNLAISCQWKGDLEKAKFYCLTGVSYSRNNPTLEGLLRSSYADILLQLNQAEKADVQIGQSVFLLENGRRHGGETINARLAAAYITQGNIFKKEKLFGPSLASYTRAEAIYKTIFKNQRKREQAKLDLLKGELFLQWQKPAEAILFFHQAMQRLLPAFNAKNLDALPDGAILYGENTLADALEGKAKCLLKLQKSSLALKAFDLAFKIERELRQHFYSRSAAMLQQAQSRARAELAIKTAFDLYQKTGDKLYAEQALLFMERSKSQLLMDDIQVNRYRSALYKNDSNFLREQKLQLAIAYQQREIAMNTIGSKEQLEALQVKKELDYELGLLQKQLKDKYPVQQINELVVEHFTAKRLFEKIPDDVKVVEFFVGDSLAFGLWMDKHGVGNMRQLDTKAEIEKLVGGFVDKWFKRGTAAIINEPQQYCREANNIYKILFKENIAGKWLIIPDGVLGQLPFDALIGSSEYRPNIMQWPYLVKQAEIHYAWSLQTLQPGNTQIVQPVFSGFFIAKEQDGLVALPSVELESKLLQDRIEGKFYRENAATIQQFEKSLGKSNLLHISTHSFLLGADSTPSLRLADGNFFLFDLYGRSFHPQLVVLSACRTADGLLAKGEGVISLSRGFMGSGANGVLSGLWNLNDDASGKLMAEFYKQLLAGHSPGGALRNAKLAWLQQNKNKPVMLLPNYWAGLVYAGNNEKVSIAAKKRGLPWLWIISGFSLTMLLVFLVAKRRLRLGSVCK